MSMAELINELVKHMITLQFAPRGNGMSILLDLRDVFDELVRENPQHFPKGTPRLVFGSTEAQTNHTILIGSMVTEEGVYLGLTVNALHIRHRATILGEQGVLDEVSRYLVAALYCAAYNDRNRTAIRIPVVNLRKVSEPQWRIWLHNVCVRALRKRIESCMDEDFVKQNSRRCVPALQSIVS